MTASATARKLTKAEAGRIGGLKGGRRGGRARARALSPTRRQAIAAMGGHGKAEEQRRARIMREVAAASASLVKVIEARKVLQAGNLRLVE